MDVAAVATERSGSPAGVLGSFRCGRGVVHFDAKMSNRAFNLGVPEQRLHGPEIFTRTGHGSDQTSARDPNHLPALLNDFATAAASIACLEVMATVVCTLLTLPPAMATRIPDVTVTGIAPLQCGTLFAFRAS